MNTFGVASSWNFPVPLIRLIGRETELAETAERLADPACRLLTLVGPGGSGKARLAQKAARALLSAEDDNRFRDVEGLCIFYDQNQVLTLDNWRNWGIMGPDRYKG